MDVQSTNETCCLQLARTSWRTGNHVGNLSQRHSCPSTSTVLLTRNIYDANREILAWRRRNLKCPFISFPTSVCVLSVRRPSELELATAKRRIFTYRPCYHIHDPVDS